MPFWADIQNGVDHRVVGWYGCAEAGFIERPGRTQNRSSRATLWMIDTDGSGIDVGECRSGRRAGELRDWTRSIASAANASDGLLSSLGRVIVCRIVG
jgi:hypothetical protein